MGDITDHLLCSNIANLKGAAATDPYRNMVRIFDTISWAITYLSHDDSLSLICLFYT